MHLTNCFYFSTLSIIHRKPVKQLLSACLGNLATSIRQADKNGHGNVRCKAFIQKTQDSWKEGLMKMKNYEKYEVGYFMPPEPSMQWVTKDHLDHAPIWCSVDLRDGNQALIVPMSLNEKVAFFQFLVSLGFKEIEVGFPAASDTEYEFLRTLIEQNLIPDDVTVQVLTQSREHIIAKTFESLKGVKRAIVHLYNSTSLAQREQVFRADKQEIIDIAVSGATLMNEYAKKMPETDFRFEYSPESFTGTEIDFAEAICNAVIDIWQPTPEKKVIINLPATVSMSMPHIYAAQIAYMSHHLHRRDSVVLSLHPHNDRGTAVADAELGLLAGGDRIEGTLFGNGERTGNVDIVTLAMNLFSHGVDPKLDFSDMPRVVEAYEKYTDMKVHPRQPYGGQLVFAAFSGSHQDAIAKGMKYREETGTDKWTVPYLLIDPQDIGREYESDVIRINSQSGKGGIGYLLEQNYGILMPAEMRENFGYIVKDVSDHEHRELMPSEIYDLFIKTYVNILDPWSHVKTTFERNGIFKANVQIKTASGEEKIIFGEGNGRLDAVFHALKIHIGLNMNIYTYKEHALEQGSTSKAMAYVGIQTEDGHVVWGVGVHNDIIEASIQALFSAINKMKG